MINTACRLKVHLTTQEVLEAPPYYASVYWTEGTPYIEIRRDDHSRLTIPMSSVAYVEELLA